jgi:hypothetical protein
MAESTASLVSCIKANIVKVSQLAANATINQQRTKILNIVDTSKTKATIVTSRVIANVELLGSSSVVLIYW